MPCNQDCNQGRDCTCGRDKSADRAIVIVVTLLLIAVVSMGFGVWKLFHATTGQQCAVEVQFKEGITATYIGTSI
jgi:hypothetical protein